MNDSSQVLETAMPTLESWSRRLVALHSVHLPVKVACIMQEELQF